MRVYDYEAFFAAEAGIGTFWWREDGKGRRVLLLKVPDVHREAPAYTLLRLYVCRTPKNWAASGAVKGWDGDEEYPTLSPSIQVKHRGPDGEDVFGWHGYLTRGELMLSR